MNQMHTATGALMSVRPRKLDSALMDRAIALTNQAVAGLELGGDAVSVRAQLLQTIIYQLLSEPQEDTDAEVQK